MKATVLEADQKLVWKDVETPTAAPGEAIVQIKAAALNRRDYWISVGKYAGIKYPTILGSDGAGIVIGVGSAADKRWIGKEVIINPGSGWGASDDFQSDDFKILGLPQDGTLTEYVKVSAANLHEKPAHLDWEHAAALPLGGLTTYRALFTKGRAQKGEKVLITGIGGGTGTTALQLAMAAGCDVWVTSGSEDKIEAAKKLGAKGGANYKAADWAEQLKATAGGFDLIIDSALGDGFAKLLDVCNPGARIVIFGATAGNIPPLNGRKIFWRQLQIIGTMMGTADEFEQMVRFVETHKIIPVTEAARPMAEAVEAINSMEHSNQFGKIVLVN